LVQKLRSSRASPVPDQQSTILSMASLIVLSLVLGQSCGQRPGGIHANNPIKVPLHQCTDYGCSGENAWATIDHDWRWVHAGPTSCWLGTYWHPEYCPNAATCEQNCKIAGVAAAYYQSHYGVTAASGGLRLAYKPAEGDTRGSRMYLLDSSDTYKIFKLKNREIAIDIDVSSLGCGVTAAAYLVSMNRKGSGTAGAGYGTGYCDAQCTTDLFIEGTMNLDESRGSCCEEIDLFEGNKFANQLNLKPCDFASGYYRSTCTGQQCGTFCHKEGCALNGYKLGAKDFYAPGGQFLDSSKPFTLVTQFKTHDNSDSGRLTQITRFFVQDDVRFGEMSETLPIGMSTSDEFCTAQASGGTDTFYAKKGMAGLGQALDQGMVLALSIRKADQPGGWTGPCPSTMTTEEVDEASGYSAATFAGIHYGMLDSTQKAVLMKKVEQISDAPIVSSVERDFGMATLGAAVALLASLAVVAGMRWRQTSSPGRPCQPEE